MKEMRARREAEKMVESKFRDEVKQQRANIKVGPKSIYISRYLMEESGQVYN